MAQETVYRSDISNTQMTSEERRRAVMSFPDREDDLAIDLTAEEAETLRGMAIGVVSVRLVSHDAEPVELTFDVTGLRKGLGLKNEAALAELLERAEPVAVVAAKGLKRSNAESVSWATPDRAGEPHRGKTTDEEKKLVHDDLEGVNARLRAKGLREIDLSNPEHVARYGLEDLVATGSGGNVQEQPAATE